MNIFKSHFWYNKSQRNGIFILVLLIIIVQTFIFVDVFTDNEIINTNTPELVAFQNQIDSLKAIEVENRKPKVYPFNPNYITDYKGEQLGMSLEEIDRLLAFRKTNKFINSKEEFQNITKVSDSLLNIISPYFKFPDWVVKQNQSSNSSRNSKESFTENSYKKKEVKISTTDINKATAEDFQSISGIGSAFSNRIIKYRSKLQGFSFDDQLYEVWGLDKEIADKVLSVFKIDEKPIIKKVNINTIEFKQLLKNPYVDYELCKKIFNYRDEVAELQNISELKHIEGFPVELYDRIVLYLEAK
ncbi:helix-hairpin-helix domain-containing protein [Polaribacter vadi]|uniref:helix-hairpin-helix domain-containing protein n=1 Tax=Polaribacter vadi TaxID=1774273 RepID=UPI0030EF8FA6|tara:strand:- start:4048 stop:4950 length:903 start_codon:yes stop_codon:yes gene_type:complete